MKLWKNLIFEILKIQKMVQFCEEKRNSNIIVKEEEEMKTKNLEERKNI